MSGAPEGHRRTTSGSPALTREGPWVSLGFQPKVNGCVRSSVVIWNIFKLAAQIKRIKKYKWIKFLIPWGVPWTNVFNAKELVVPLRVLKIFFTEVLWMICAGQLICIYLRYQYLTWHIHLLLVKIPETHSGTFPRKTLKAFFKVFCLFLIC